MKITRNYTKQKPNPHLHSPAHVLADELSSKLGDPKHFGFYLKMATTVDHNVLRKIMGDVLESKSTNPGALYAYLIKKHNREKTSSSGHSIWLLPEPNAQKQLKDYIVKLADLFKSQAFQPHLPILSDLETSNIGILNQLAELQGFMVELQPIQMEENYFKSIYLPVVKNKHLSATRKFAKKFFNPDLTESFHPYIPILFGNFKSEYKSGIVKQALEILPKSILLNQLALVKTQGKVEEWTIIETLSLQKNI